MDVYGLNEMNKQLLPMSKPIERLIQAPWKDMVHFKIILTHPSLPPPEPPQYFICHILCMMQMKYDKTKHCVYIFKK